MTTTSTFTWQARRAFAALAVAAALGTSAAAIAPSPAAAHTGIKSKRPGATAKTNITLVAVIFNDDVRSAGLTVTAPGGKKVSKGTVRDPRDDRRFQTNLTGGLKPGKYKVVARWTATDGHKQSSSWTFTLKK